jgi:hypothetical protein
VKLLLLVLPGRSLDRQRTGSLAPLAAWRFKASHTDLKSIRGQYSTVVSAALKRQDATGAKLMEACRTNVHSQVPADRTIAASIDDRPINAALISRV